MPTMPQELFAKKAVVTGSSRGIGRAIALELAAAATFGSAAAATEWWLGPDPDSPRRMPSAEFVAHLTTIMLSTINGTADLLGVVLNPDLPLRGATRQTQPVVLSPLVGPQG